MIHDEDLTRIRDQRAERLRSGHDRRPIERSVWPWVFALGLLTLGGAFGALVRWVML